MSIWVMRRLGLGLIVMLFVGGGAPAAAGLFAAPWDKLAHVAYFFALTLLLAAGFGWQIVWVAALALVVGFVDEWHQSFLPGRVASASDWAADLVGVVLAVWFVKVGLRRKPRLQNDLSAL